MKEFSVRQYETKDYAVWNAFIEEAKNATFLFHRDFMEYHNDRFTDYSLLVFKEGKLVGLLPANTSGNEIHSHQGLTYGGLVYKENLKLAAVIAVFSEVLRFLHENGFPKLHCKTIPGIYHQKPAEELLYALFLAEAKLTRRDSLAVIDMNKGFSISKGRMEGVNKGAKKNLTIKETTDFEAFWQHILLPNLDKKHKAKPVHSLEEIQLLHSRFPKNIRQFNVYSGQEIVAGATVFESSQVAHMQYISAGENKNELGSLDFLFHHLLCAVFEKKLFFDFGISNENQGKKLNNGLSFWKESFGAGTMVQDFYEVTTSNFHLLETIIL
ncbi:GNAT family N-acetyltransferase [Flavobacterium humi]|uniref:GNAT family N-acetyltransferase n=1 Tax=Flavobacterium humi TaxID=2562683 RepID=A0A4Z0L6Z5_9FLAO|nr:GNAT family N-acetyltransferase [Flavobacterium humi]TGD58157.1 GNAT family N-acetyltransferase [Flavobacterium humi]